MIRHSSFPAECEARAFVDVPLKPSCNHQVRIKANLVILIDLLIPRPPRRSRAASHPVSRWLLCSRMRTTKIGVLCTMRP